MEVISRSDAMSKGLKVYFTGTPCSRGFIAQRRVSNRVCLCDACASVSNDRVKEWLSKNPSRPPKKPETRRKEYLKNRQKELDKQKEYRNKNRDANRDRQKKWRSENSGKVRASNLKRRSVLLKRIPSWFSELDELVVIEASTLAKLRTQCTGFDWHVDHLIPLQADKASGLHCALNIQVVPAALNVSKQNKMLWTEPFEWLKW